MVSRLIHPTAVVHPESRIHEDVTIGAFSIVGANVEVGRGSVIGSHCILGEASLMGSGERLVLGQRCVIRSHTVLYGGSTFGDELETGHHVTIRERTTAGRNLRIGTSSDIQGDCEVGNFVRIHSGVFIAKLIRIGNFVWIFPNVVLTNDPTPPSDYVHHRGADVGDYCAIGASSCIGPGVKLGARSFVAAMSMVTRDVEEGMAVKGMPARPMGPASGIKIRDGSGSPAYPWTQHFSRGYPQDIVESWSRMGGENDA